MRPTDTRYDSVVLAAAGYQLQEQFGVQATAQKDLAQVASRDARQNTSREGLIDTEGPMSVSQLHACMPPGTLKGTAETAIKREFAAGRIKRVAPGNYVLAPPKPPEPSQPAPPPDPPKVRSDGHTNEEWFAALEAWLVDPTSWDVEKFGPPLDQPGHKSLGTSR